MLKLYILTDGKNYVMDDPIHPGRVMYSTSPVNAKKFTFKQARALLNNKSKKLSWIRSFNMVDDSSGEKIAEQEVRSRSNKGIFVGKNDIDFDVSILDQIMQETNNLLGIAGWNCSFATKQQILDNDFYIINPTGYYELKLKTKGMDVHLITIMVNVPFSELRKRAKKRGDFSTWEANYKKESEEFTIFEKSNLIDYFVLNDGDIEESIKKMENVIKKDKSKRGSTDEN